MDLAFAQPSCGSKRPKHVLPIASSKPLWRHTALPSWQLSGVERMQIFRAVWNVQSHPLLAWQSCSCLPTSLCLAFPSQSQQLCLRMVQSSQNIRKSPESLAQDPHQLAVSPACQRRHCLQPWLGAASGNRGQPRPSTHWGKKQCGRAQLKAQATDPQTLASPKEEETTVKSCVTAEWQEAIVTLRGSILSHCILRDTNHVYRQAPLIPKALWRPHHLIRSLIWKDSISQTPRLSQVPFPLAARPEREQSSLGVTMTADSYKWHALTSACH